MQEIKKKKKTQQNQFLFTGFLWDTDLIKFVLGKVFQKKKVKITFTSLNWCLCL